MIDLPLMLLLTSVLGSILAGFVCSMMGIFVVRMNISSIGFTMSHAAFAGAAFGIWLDIDPLFSALLFASLTALLAANEVARQGHIVTLGIQPGYPATGFGYIRRRERVAEASGFDVYKVDAFVEKPDVERATEFVASGLYSWNSGMFIWQVGRLMAEFAEQMPAFHSQLQTIASALGTAGYAEAVAEIWPSVRKETIDYGIMEHADNVMVIPVDLGWVDIGGWEAVYELHASDEGANVVVGTDHIGVDTSASLIRGGNKLIATIGLRDTIIIDTEDAILICARDRAQDVKTIVEQLEADGKTEYL